jgi:hypothetical protein
MKPNQSAAFAAACLLSTWQDRALACSVILPEKQTVSCGVVTDAGGIQQASVTSAQLQIEGVQVQRSRYAPPGLGDCGELGSTTVRFRLAGSQAWPSDVGVLVSLRQGNFSYFQPPLTQLPAASGWLFLPQTLPPTGAVRFFGPDDPQQPLELRLEVRAIDCHNNLSAPIELHISDPGRASDAGVTTVNPAASTGTGGSVAVASSETGAGRPAPSTTACSTTYRTPAPSFPDVFGVCLGGLALVERRRARVSAGPSMWRRVRRFWRSPRLSVARAPSAPSPAGR